MFCNTESGDLGVGIPIHPVNGFVGALGFWWGMQLLLIVAEDTQTDLCETDAAINEKIVRSLSRSAV